MPSQRLKALLSKQLPSPSANGATGVELQLSLEGGILRQFELHWVGSGAIDEFAGAFFYAYQGLFAGRALSKLKPLSVREWESYWRDLNHQVLLDDRAIERAQAPYDELLEILLGELWTVLWKRIRVPLPPPDEWEKLSWIRRLERLAPAIEDFGRGLFNESAKLEIAQWAPVSEKNGASDLYLRADFPFELTTVMKRSLEKFLHGQLTGIKEIKLVA